METNIYRRTLEYSLCAFAHHEAIFDVDGKMIDHIILDVNGAFEDITGLKRKDIINKQYVMDIAKGGEAAKKQVEFYEKTFAEKGPLEFEDISNDLNRNYSIRAFRDGSKRFVTVINNMTFQRKMQEIGQYFIDNIGNEIDYDRITEFARYLSGAEYGAFNLLGENEKESTTVAVIGISENIKKALTLLGFDLVGKKWPYDPRKDRKTQERVITYFDGLHDLSGNMISESIILTLEKTFNLGKVVVAKIIKEERVLGDFTLILKKGKSLRNQDLLILFMSQLGLFIEKNRLDNALKANQRMFSTLAEFAPFGFLSCDIQGEIKYANQRLIEIMDSPSLEASKKINLLTFPRLIESGFSQKLLQCMEENRVIDHEMKYKSLWDRESWLRVHFTPYRDDNSVIGSNIIIEDITEKKINEDELLEKVNRDPLTRTYNRNVLETILAERLNDSKKEGLLSCLAAVDIDDFKIINDSFGHIVGDSVLKHVAARIKEEIGENDLVVRTGGDEFLVYLHDVGSKERAWDFIKVIFQVISEKYSFEVSGFENTLDLNICFSIGISLFPDHGESLELLMAKADEALYKVKNSGKCDFAFA